MNYEKYSVLMSVYHKEQSEYLKESIESILKQSILPDEIVLVKDGPLTKDLNDVIYYYSDNSLFNIVELSENVGLGKALEIGVHECRNEFIARMDTDDISHPNRCEEQLKLLQNNPEISVVGSSVVEFIGSIHNKISIKEVQTNSLSIARKMRSRNPMNHPTVMFRKSDVLLAGNYQDWYLNEDYFLWIRMLKLNMSFTNISEPLVFMRITNETYLRRGGFKYFLTQKRLFDYMLSNGMITIVQYLFNNVSRFVIRVVFPNSIRKIIYVTFLRKKIKVNNN